MRKMIAGLLITALAVTSVGCGQTPSVQAAGKEKEAVQIGIIFDTFVIPRWQRDRDLFVTTAKELGAEVDVQNANGSIAEQKKEMEYFISQQMDAIVVIPIEAEALQEEIKAAKDAGIPVISYDRLALDSNVDLYISFDNEAVGGLMGKALADTLEPGSKVLMICGSREDNNVAQVEIGFRKAIQKNSLMVTDCVYMKDWNTDYVEEYLESHLDEVSQVQAIMCGNDALAGQAITTLVEHQRMGDIKVVGQDADLDGCQRIVEGMQYMTVYKSVNQLAAEAARAAVSMAKGEKVETTTTISDGTHEVPYICLTPIAVTAENMDQTIIDSGFHTKEEVYMNRPELMK
ncbi:MAG: substrate-binding domain-containing protein [Lachnospiraceae bacterium]|nr:substrate-binding domain-containing protein [Lachnospiraceae bacterium]